MKLEDVKEQIDNYFDNVDPDHLLYLYNREQQLKEKNLLKFLQLMKFLNIKFQKF